MANKKFLFNLIWIIIVALGIVLIIFANKYANNIRENNVELTINYSEISSELDLENLTYKATDYQGNDIVGESYYGVDGTYTKEKPIIQGGHYYTYWVKNKDYYIAPAELEIDETHRNQSIIAKAYKKVNLSDDVNVVDRNNFYDYNEISFVKYDNNFDIAEFEIKYQSEERTRFPFGAMIIFEYDKQINDLECGDTIKVYFPDFYSMQSVENRADSFEIEEDRGDWERMEINCFIGKYSEKVLENKKIKFSIYPKDFFLIDYDFKEEYELELGVEDYFMNQLNKPIFEGEIAIK